MIAHLALQEMGIPFELVLVGRAIEAHKMIKYDCAKYGSSAERKRLIGRWEKEVHSLPR
jgi:hypothetical protein